MMKLKGLISIGAMAVALSQTVPAFAQTGAEDKDDTAVADAIIVTGTRTSGLTVAESAAPIKLLDNSALSHVGQPNLNQALTQLVPSFVAESFGGDTANLTLSARLRGLSPNHALVLINGKRRHSTANLHVLGGAYQGGAAPDLDLIPPSAIDHIEVLEDGAAAQYGSDAIAGVINIILKDNDSGGMASATAGQYYKSDGETYSATMNYGTKLGENGFLSTTLFYRYHNFSDNGGPDSRVAFADGTPKTQSSPQLTAAYAAIPGFPHVNHIVGDARSRLATISYNAGYDFGDVQVYSFGTLSRRVASAYENVRLPDRVIASPVLGVKGTFTTPGELILYPQGFNPREGLEEEDFAVTAGVKGQMAGWNWDLSSTYGQDKNKIFTFDSANASLFVDTHFTPTDFYDGSFKNKEWTTNLDVTREIDLGLAEPLNFAFGAEYRKNTYAISQGDPASIYKEGGQSFPGFQPTDAGSHSRENVAGYIDLALTPVEGLKLDGAMRLEHYTDFGTKLIEKLTGRYDFSPAFALRGTVSTGFRAPTLAEEFYSATNVGPTSAFVQLPANSAAAKLLGFHDLKPEKSTNFSLGMVARPAPTLTITIDAYQVKVKDRIVGTGSILGKSGTTVVNQAVLDAITAHGNILDDTVTFVGVSLFANGVDTRTRGIDLTASYMTDLGGLGKINWTLSANYNKTVITKLDPSALLDQTAITTLESASPRYKIVAGLLYTTGGFSFNLRETFFGKTFAYYSPNSTNYFKNTVKSAAITDLEASYDFSKTLQIALGANNLFDKKPETVKIVTLNNGATYVNSDGGAVYYRPLSISPYGINGGYYYARLNIKF